MPLVPNCCQQLLFAEGTVGLTNTRTAAFLTWDGICSTLPNAPLSAGVRAQGFREPNAPGWAGWHVVAQA
eukprot:356047-Chlamydomonas_euryale.AAC.2